MLNLPNPSDYSVGKIYTAKATISLAEVNEIFSKGGATTSAIGAMITATKTLLTRNLVIAAAGPALAIGGAVIAIIAEFIVDEILSQSLTYPNAVISVDFICEERTAYKQGVKYTFKQWEYSDYSVKLV